MNIMKNEYIVRCYRPGDESRLNDLFNMVFNQRRSLEAWYWLYRDNLSDGLKIISVAESDGEIIAEHANVPVPFKFKDKAVMIAQPVDNLVHPDFRGGAIIRAIHRHSYKKYSEEDLPFGFGFPTDVYYTVGKRLCKYEDLCSIPVLFKRLNLRGTFKGRISSLPALFESGIRTISSDIYRLQVLAKKTPCKCSVQRVSVVDRDIDVLWERAKNRYGIMTVRDCRFLTWRYLDKPGDSYDIFLARDRDENPAGYIVVKVSESGGGSTGYIVDILSVNSIVDKFLLRTALLYFISKKVDFSLCRILREDKVYESLKELGFREHEAFGSTHFIYQLFDQGLDLPFFKNPKNWHLTYGDQIDVEF